MITTEGGSSYVSRCFTSKALGANLVILLCSLGKKITFFANCFDTHMWKIGVILNMRMLGPLFVFSLPTSFTIFGNKGCSQRPGSFQVCDKGMQDFGLSCVALLSPRPVPGTSLHRLLSLQLFCALLGSRGCVLLKVAYPRILYLNIKVL